MLVGAELQSLGCGVPCEAALASGWPLPSPQGQDQGTPGRKPICL